MSVTVMSRVFWTSFDGLSYKEPNGRAVKISSASAKITMLAIADSSDDFGDGSWNSLETLAKKAGLTRRSVIRVIKALVDHGYLVSDGVTTYGTNNMRIVVNRLNDPITKRPKVGRPHKPSDTVTDGEFESGKSSDTVTTELEIGDSVTNIGDSVTKTSDTESPYPLLIHTNPLKDSPAPKQPTAQQQMFKAIMDITHADQELNASALGSAAKKLIKAGYTPADVANFERYWYAEDWRGKKKQVPEIFQVVSEMGKSKKNGRFQPNDPMASVYARYPPGTPDGDGLILSTSE